MAGAVNYRGIEVDHTCSFTNDRVGFEKMMHWVTQQQQRLGLTRVILGMESTGHYGNALARWLQDHGQEVVQVNPATVKRNKENRDNRPSKNDAKDALTIADSISRGYYHDWSWHEGTYRKLRCVVNEYEALSTDLTAIGNRLQRLLDEGFPEFLRVFKKWNGPRAIATLKAFPLPEDLKHRTIEQVIEGWRTTAMSRAGGKRGREIAARLLAAARASVGVTDIAPELRRNIQRLLEQRERLLADQEQVMNEILALLGQLPEADLAALKEVGISPWLTAVILANTGPLSQYAHGQQILALAGLNLCEDMSGKRKGQIVLSKRGRRQLRKYLYVAMIGLVANHEAFRAWHDHNVHTRRIKKQTSIFKLIGKLVRMLVALARNGESFDAGKAQALKLRTAA